jgi:hypothetical protein
MALKLNTDDLRHLAAVRDGEPVELFFISRLMVLGLLNRAPGGETTITEKGVLELQRAKDPRKPWAG